MSRPSTWCYTIFHALRCFPRGVHRRTGHCRVHSCPAVHVPQHRAPAGLGRRIYTHITLLQPHTPSCHSQHIPRHRILSMDSPALLSRASFRCCYRIHSSNFPSPPQVIANGGSLITNMFSFLEPTPFALTTPAALKPYGWTTTELWCAPLITGLYAFLTHAQPFWAEFHGVISTILGGVGDKVEPMDPESARALCALILSGIFSTRTAKNFGLVWKRSEFCHCYFGAILMVIFDAGVAEVING